MKAFGDQLRKERLARGISLEQIAEATLINIRYLQALEEGEMDVLPQAYLRAFLREYSAVIGLEPAEVIRRYDTALETSRQATAPVAHLPQPENQRRPLPALLLESKVGWAALILFALAAFAGIVGLLGGGKSPPAQEVPFQDVVREQEERLGASLAETASRTQPTRTERRDSLLLAATISDSLWLQIVIDQGQPLEYLFGPNRRASWKAVDRFLLTLGNAGAAEFTLNGTRIGKLGQPGAVARNVEINRNRLPKD